MRGRIKYDLFGAPALRRARASGRATYNSTKEPLAVRELQLYTKERSHHCGAFSWKTVLLHDDRLIANLDGVALHGCSSTASVPSLRIAAPMVLQVVNTDRVTYAFTSPAI